MRRPWLIALLAACALVVLLAFTRQREPRYHGRSLSQWLEIEFVAGVKGDREAEDAIRRIGPQALPWLVKWVDVESSWKHKFWKIVDGLPSRCRSVFPRPVLRSPANSELTIVGFMIIGSEASPAVPQLQDLVRRSKPPHQNAILAIRCLGFIGPAARPALLELTGDSDPGICIAARIALVQTMPNMPELNQAPFRPR